MKTKYLRMFFALMVVLMVALSSTSVAFAMDESSGTDTQAPTEAAGGASESETTSPIPLTPEGNMTLVDDISGETADTKQFLTVTTKDGSYFYIVIDRVGDTQNVYFLNLVDESDLSALAIDQAPPAQETTETAAPVQEAEQATAEQEQAPESEAEAESGLNIGAILAAVFVLALIGGGAFFYFKVLRPNGARKKGSSVDDLDLDDFDFGGDATNIPYGADTSDGYEQQNSVGDFEDYADETEADSVSDTEETK